MTAFERHLQDAGRNVVALAQEHMVIGDMEGMLTALEHAIYIHRYQEWALNESNNNAHRSPRPTTPSLPRK